MAQEQVEDRVGDQGGDRDRATEIAGTIECVVADQVRPAMEYLEAASRVTAEELSEQQALLRRLRGRMGDEIG